MKEDEERVKEAGFDGYITKPYILTSLLEDIKRYLVVFHSNSATQSAQPGSAPAQSDPPEPAGEPEGSPAARNSQSSGKADHPSSELTHES
jgi:DNA-binding response OmpR family regulator